jgi:hypothetical protein
MEKPIDLTNTKPKTHYYEGFYLAYLIATSRHFEGPLDLSVDGRPLDYVIQARGNRLSDRHRRILKPTKCYRLTPILIHDGSLTQYEVVLAILRYWTAHIIRRRTCRNVSLPQLFSHQVMLTYQERLRIIGEDLD